MRPAMSVTKVPESIAKNHLNIPTLRARNSDSLDFHDCGVWQIKKALEEAYAEGFQACRRRP
jgi:Family of unknown function (DUF6900)